MNVNWFNKAPQAVSVPERIEPVVNSQMPDVQNSAITTMDEFGEALGVVGSLAGPVVNAKTSMRLAIAYRCTALIAGAMATMPRPVYTKTSTGREKDGSHRLSSLLNLQPTPLMSAAVFWETITASMLLEGDGFAIIMRDAYGEPVEFLPISPSHIHVEQKKNRLVYYVLLDGKPRGFDQGDVLHFQGFGFNGTRSMSIVKKAACNSLGMAMAMEQFSADFFSKGTHSDIAITKGGKWSTEDQENLRNAWEKTYGGLGKSGKPLTIANGLEIHQLKVSAADTQLLQSREFENINICTAFGMPAFMVNQGSKVTAWGSGMAEMSMGFVRYTLSPHMLRFDQELNRKLLMGTKHYIETNPAGLMRGTLKERNESYKSAMGGSNVPGYMSINEVRTLENMPPINGDIYDKPYDPRVVNAAPFEEKNNA